MPYNQYQPYTPYQPNTFQQNPFNVAAQAYQQAQQMMQPQMPQPQMSGANQPMQQPAPQMTQPPVQNSAPFNVRSEQEARDWPIAPGNSLTFINEAEGYVYTKTSLNQFDRPQFVKYKLVREDTQEAAATPVSAPNSPPAPTTDYALRSDMDALRGEIMGEIEGFRARLDNLTSEKPAGKGKKKEADGND